MLSPYRIISSTPVVDKKFPTNASISLNGTRDENDDDHHSHYLSFEDVFNLFPLNCNFKTVSIYGIIESFDSSNGTLLLMDQTRKHFAVYANIVPPKSEKSRTRLPTRPGDIIRIIDLRLHSNFTKTCSDVANCVVNFIFIHFHFYFIFCLNLLCYFFFCTQDFRIIPRSQVQSTFG